MASKAARRDRRQARDEARLKYQPQADALSSVLSGLHADLKDSVKQAKAGAKMTERAAKKALPAAQKIYAAGLAGSTPEQSLVRSELSKLAPDSPFATATKIETAGSTQRLKEGRAATLKELVGRQADAVAGAQQEVRSLRQGYRSDRAKTLDQLLNVSKESGLYAATRYGQLSGDRAKLKVTKRGQTLAHKDRQASLERQKERDAEAAKPKPPKPPTPAEKRARNKEVNTTTSEIQKAIAQANQLKKGGRDRHESASTLLVGRPMQSIKDPKTKQTVKVPAIDSFDQVIASVGLDMAYDGHISKKNQQILRKRYPGVLKALGLPLKRPAVNLVAGVTVPGQR